MPKTTSKNTKAKKTKNDMNKYIVGFDSAQRRVHIYNDGQDMEPGFKEVGSFELAIDPVTNAVKRGDVEGPASEGGDHIFITEAKRVLQENTPATDFSNMRFEDKASNQPLAEKTGNTYVPTTKEVEDKLSEPEDKNEIKDKK